MYVRYVAGNVFDVPDVRDVRHFSLRPCDNQENGPMELYDAGMVLSSALADAAVELLTVQDKESKRKNRAALESYAIDQLAWLASYESKEAAMRVLDDICKAIDAGKRYFDLTQYNGNGELITNPKPEP